VENITELQNRVKDPKTQSATPRPESALLETHQHTSSSRQASEETIGKLSE
jgi:phosphoribosylamine-glycine ligase